MEHRDANTTIPAAAEAAEQPWPGREKGREHQLASSDQAKVEEAVRYLNERIISSGLELAKETGEYILDTFFDGEYGNFADPSRSKSTSFRALLAREDLLLSGVTLYSFVRISHQLKLLPAEVITRLTLAHHRALLPLPEPEQKEALARRALAEGWTSQSLAGEVRKLLPRSRPGRKPLPPLVKGMRRVVKAVELTLAEEVTAEKVRMLESGQALTLTEQVEESLGRLEALKKTLEEALEGPAEEA